MTPFLLAAVIAYLVYPIVQLFEQRFVPRPAAILIVYSLIGVVLGVVFWIMLPQLASQIDEIIAMIPSQAEKLEDLGQGAMRRLERITLPRVGQEIAATITQRVQLLLEDLGQVSARPLRSDHPSVGLLPLANFGVLPLARPRRKRERLFLYIPMQYRSQVKNVLREINRA